MKLSEASSSSNADNKVFVIVVDPINLADIVTTPIAPSAPAARGIVIREPTPTKPCPKKVLEGKAKKKQREAFVAPSQESTPSPLRKARMEAQENRLREEAWLQKQKIRFQA